MESIVRFRRRLQERMAERVVETRHGRALLAPSIRHVYDHNYLSVEHGSVPPDVLAAEADEAMADCFHRRVVVEDAAPGLAADFVDLGYVCSTHLVLAHGRRPDRRVDASMVREVQLGEVLPVRRVATLREQWGDEEIAAELNEAKRHVARAVPTRFFGAFAGDDLVGWCELRVGSGVAQIEDVEVLAEFRGQGLGRAVVQHALDEGLRAADVVFLEALADDWPRELYAKLGFVPAGRRDFYTKLPQPVTRVRLRTPRLELRVPTVAERRRIEVVEAGGIGQAFVAFVDGEPIGIQAVNVGADGEIAEALVAREHRGKGYEAEMRAAALTYALGDFDSLVPVEIVGAR